MTRYILQASARPDKRLAVLDLDTMDQVSHGDDEETMRQEVKDRNAREEHRQQAGKRG